LFDPRRRVLREIVGGGGREKGKKGKERRGEEKKGKEKAGKRKAWGGGGERGRREQRGVGVVVAGYGWWGFLGGVRGVRRGICR